MQRMMKRPKRYVYLCVGLQPCAPLCMSHSLHLSASVCLLAIYFYISLEQVAAKILGR